MTNEEMLKDLHISGVEIFVSKHCPRGAIRVHWWGAAGFGQYDFVLGEDGIFRGYSEHMERTNDKYFSKELLRLIHEALVVED